MTRDLWFVNVVQFELGQRKTVLHNGTVASAVPNRSPVLYGLHLPPMDGSAKYQLGYLGFNRKE